MTDGTLTPTEPNLGELGSPREQPYILRGLRDPPTLTRAAGQSGSKVCAGVSFEAISITHWQFEGRV